LTTLRRRCLSAFSAFVSAFLRFAAPLSCLRSGCLRSLRSLFLSAAFFWFFFRCSMIASRSALSMFLGGSGWSGSVWSMTAALEEEAVMARKQAQKSSGEALAARLPAGLSYSLGLKPRSGTEAVVARICKLRARWS